MIGTPDPPAIATGGQETFAVTYLMLFPLRARGEIIGLRAEGPAILPHAWIARCGQ